MMHKAFKYRIYPNKKQQEILSRHFGCSRFVFNHFLRRKVDHYAETGKVLTYHDTSAELTNLKKLPEYVWLKEVNSQSLQQSLRNLDTAYNNFFNKRAEFPVFKKRQGCQSFQVPQHFILDENRLMIPKMAPIRVVVHRPLEGKARQVTISRGPAGEYHASILSEIELPEPAYSGGEVGIDLGLSSFLITSEGEKVEPGNYYRRAEARLARLTRGCPGRRKALRTDSRRKPG